MGGGVKDRSTEVLNSSSSVYCLYSLYTKVKQTGLDKRNLVCDDVKASLAPHQKELTSFPASPPLLSVLDLLTMVTLEKV